MDQELYHQALASNDQTIEWFTDSVHSKFGWAPEEKKQMFALAPQENNIFSMCNNSLPPYTSYQLPVYFSEIAHRPYTEKWYFIYTGSTKLPFTVFRYHLKWFTKELAYNYWASQKNASLPCDVLPQLPDEWTKREGKSWQITDKMIDAIDFTNLDFDMELSWNLTAFNIYDTARDMNYLYSVDRGKAMQMAWQVQKPGREFRIFHFYPARGQDVLSPDLFSGDQNNATYLNLHFSSLVYIVAKEHQQRDVVILNQSEQPDEHVTILPNFPTHIIINDYRGPCYSQYLSGKKAVYSVKNRIVAAFQPPKELFDLSVVTPQIRALKELIQLQPVFYNNETIIQPGKVFIALGFMGEDAAMFQLIKPTEMPVKTMNLKNADTYAFYQNLRVIERTALDKIQLLYSNKQNKTQVQGKMVIGCWHQTCPHWKFTEIPLGQFVKA